MGIFSLFKKRNHQEVKEDDEIEYLREDNEYEEEREITTKEDFHYNIEVDENDNYIDNKEIEENLEDLSPEMLDSLVIEQILKVIENYKDFESVQSTVKEATRLIGRKNVEVLKDYISGRVSKPQRLKKNYEEIGQWARTVENAVLTIIYGFEEDGVDELLKISIMKSEVRFKAINLLCKLAARGIEREKIIDSIIYIMKPLKEEEILRVLSFLSQIKNSSKVDRLLELYYKKFLLENSLEYAYDTVINRVNLRGYYKEDELIFFKVLALFEGKLEADLILEGEKGIIDFSNVNEDIRVKAAVSYYSLNKEDKEINYRLLYLRDNSLDSELRKFLSTVIN